MKRVPWFLVCAAALLGADRTIVSIHAAADTELTADPRSPFWRDVPPTIAENDQMGQPTPGHRTEIRTRWTEKNLYVLFVCPYHELYSKPNPVVEQETNHLWDWDTAEVFVGWDFKNTHRYKEFEVSPHGEWVDLDIDIDHPLPEQGWRWNSGFQSKARIDAAAKIWYAEMQIPWKSIDERQVRAGNELRINFYRLQGPGPDRKHIAWQPTNARNFHVPEAFGIVRLGRDVGEWLDGIAQKHLNKRDAEVAQIRNVDQAQERQAFVRRKILELIGGLPDYAGPLNARVTGRIDRPGFTIDKLIFESLPGLYVTANLYRPDKPGKFPGILLPLGHNESGKPAVQRIAANLALKEFVVLVYDPVGQGERLQAYDKRTGSSLVGRATEQHLLAGAKDELIGLSFARDRIFDAQRALDYLMTRPEVDTQRIGCTGCSGGGTLATYISALDPRIKVAAPTCYITSFHELFTGAIGDPEQSIHGFISSGLDLADYIEMFAPKPWLIGSTEADFFPLAGAKRAFEEARRWYAMWGAEDRIKWVVGPGGHGTPLVVREGIYEWMIRWLNRGEGSAKEQDVSPLAESDLWATEHGQVAELPGSRDLYGVIAERFENQKTHGSREELAKQIQVWTAAPEDGMSSTGIVIEKSSNGVHVKALAPPGPLLSGAWVNNARASMLGLNLAGLRAREIMNALDGDHVRAEAEGVAGIWLLLAAAADPRIESVTLHRTPYSLRAAVRDETLARDLADGVIAGFALRWDLDDLVELIKPRSVSWVDPTDWMGHVVRPKGDYRYSPAAQ